MQKLAVLLSVVLLVFGLTGCNLEDPETNNPPGQTTNSRTNNNPGTTTPDTALPDANASPDTGESQDATSDTSPLPGPDGCTALTCSEAGAQCGFIEDGCGQTIDCGDCPFGTCDRNNQCRCSPETNGTFCDRLAAECGELTAADNCGNERTVDCGACEGVFQCGDGGTPNRCGCTPGTCDEGMCGQLADGCGNVINCGTCTTPGENCGGGNAGPNRCGAGECIPATCSSLGAQCGVVGDGCGNTVDCGSCTGIGQSCTGSNQCVCKPETRTQFCQRLGAQCGQRTGTDNCGNSRTEDCGGCNAPETCSNNSCVCIGESTAELCQANGLTCGPAQLFNQCGQLVDINCGNCAGPHDVCTANQCVCQGESAATLCNARNFNCDSAQIVDRCSVTRTVDCGACGPNDTCSNNRCACVGEDAAQLCTANGRQCGPLTVQDSCGATRQIDCGDCGLSNVCNGGQCCQPRTCQQAGAACGSTSDGCGGTLFCGGCSHLDGWVDDGLPANCCFSNQSCLCRQRNYLTYSCGANNQCAGTITGNDTEVSQCSSCSDGNSCTTDTCSNGQCGSTPVCAGTTASCGCTTCTDCRLLNGWYSTGLTAPCCSGFDTSCECYVEEERRYSCNGTTCDYSVVQTRAVITTGFPCRLCQGICDVLSGQCCGQGEICLEPF
jgi:hypothetical protein